MLKHNPNLLPFSRAVCIWGCVPDPCKTGPKAQIETRSHRPRAISNEIAEHLNFAS